MKINDNISVLFAGDYCPSNRINPILEREQYNEIFKDIRSYILDNDYSIVNFETCIANETSKPIDKCGPNLKTTEKAVESLKWAGFKCVTLANNHFRDYGDDAVVNTINLLNANGIDNVGGGKNANEASKILYKTIGDETLAIINACEHEFSIATDNHG